MNWKDVTLSNKQAFAVFVAAMLVWLGVPVINSVSKNEKNTIKNQLIASVDAEIKSVNYKIDSLYGATDGAVADSLARNPAYKWVADNTKHIDSLRGVNQEYMTRAYDAARKYSVFDVVYNNESVFERFGHVQGVKNVKWKYYANKKKIQEFDDQRAKVEHLPMFVRTHFESKTNAQVRELQKQIDSLLVKKNCLIHEKVK